MILTCGEALIDMLPRTGAAGEELLLPTPGGAVFNTAIALGRLGARVGFFSGLSTDMFGRMLARALARAGVDCRLLIRSPRPTTLAFVELVEGQAHYAFYDENTAGRMLRPDDLPALPENVRALFFGGISLVATPCAQAYETLMQRARAAGRITMLDPNIRPGFIDEPAPYRARIERMLALADIVKLSDEDIAWLMGPGDALAQARSLVGDSDRIVFLTEGARGAHALTRRHSVFAPAPKARVVDTVGAGDTFNAGVLAALQQAGALAQGRSGAPGQLDKDTLGAALSLGTRAAARSVERAGANPPTREEL